MKNTILKLLLILNLFVLLAIPAATFVPAPAHAAVGIPEYLIPKETPLRDLNVSIGNQAKTGKGTEVAVSASNRILQFIANGLLFVAAPLAILALAHAGQNYGFAFGDQTKLEAAKRETTWALLGLGLIIVSYIIVRLMISIFFLIPEQDTPPNLPATQPPAATQPAKP